MNTIIEIDNKELLKVAELKGAVPFIIMEPFSIGLKKIKNLYVPEEVLRMDRRIYWIFEIIIEIINDNFNVKCFTESCNIDKFIVSGCNNVESFKIQSISNYTNKISEDIIIIYSVGKLCIWIKDY